VVGFPVAPVTRMRLKVAPSNRAQFGAFQRQGSRGCDSVQGLTRSPRMQQKRISGPLNIRCRRVLFPMLSALATPVPGRLFAYVESRASCFFFFWGVSALASNRVVQRPSPIRAAAGHR